MARTALEKSRRKDRLAELFIRIGGIAVILSVVWILVMISRVAIPLFLPPAATKAASLTVPPELAAGRIMAFGSDENQLASFVLDQKGTVHFLRADGSLASTEKVPAAPGNPLNIVSVESTGKAVYNLLWDNGAVTSVVIAVNATKGSDGTVAVIAEIKPQDDLSFEPEPGAVASFVRLVEGKGNIRVDRLANDRLRISHRLIEKDLLGNEKRSTVRSELDGSEHGRLTAVSLDAKGHYLYAGTDKGMIVRWDVSEPGQSHLIDSSPASDSRQQVSALAPVLGDVSLAIGTAGGELATWFPVKVAGSGEDKRLTRIHTLGAVTGGVMQIVPSPRDKSVFSVSSDGRSIHADHMTSERKLVTINAGIPLSAIALSPKGSSLVALDKGNVLTVWKLNIPHPEISLGTLFGTVWYEGYDKPEFTWQSSAANDDFEPKLSLVPLIFGTIKATLFAMLFAVPLALLAALYTSQFMSPTLKGRVKPVVEIMAAIPSVVIGFLAGLWLAPLIDKSVLTVFLTIVLVPVLLVVTIFFWKRIKTASRLQRFTRGIEFAAMIPVVLLGVYLAFVLSGLAEAGLFGGDFKQWLFSTLGVRYDQRNSIIIAIALGFAVIPIIFTIAEDAISNVPRNLTAASLALGASRWQTAWRVVLPSALPGVFSAIMIGFGRAIGETMIVLMATGNTPIMSWSLFNGLRSLSANIAVEIPEAPLNSSLYRTLFLSAVLLFVFTFIINTVAEMLRQRFRKKYGRY